MAHDDPELDDGWLESTEGDLDPDLTEEAGYSWDAPERSLLTTAVRIVTLTVLIVLVASIVLPVIL